jgi:hypothetical protein
VAPSVVIILALALAILTATCAKVCFRLMAETEKRQSEAHVGKTEL